MWLAGSLDAPCLVLNGGRPNDYFAIVPASLKPESSVRNVRAHREKVVHVERTGFAVSVRIVNNDSRSKISRFKRNMPACESVLSDLKTEN